MILLQVMITPVKMKESIKPQKPKPKLKSRDKSTSQEDKTVPTKDLLKTDEDVTEQDTANPQPVTETSSTPPASVSQADPIISTPVITEAENIAVNIINTANTTVTTVITAPITATTVTSTLSTTVNDTIPTMTTPTNNITTIAEPVPVATTAL